MQLDGAHRPEPAIAEQGHHGFRRALVVSVALSIFVLSLGFSGRLHLDEDIVSLLPKDDPVVSDFLSVISRFQALDSLYVDVGAASDTQGSYEQIVAVADALHERLRKSGMFTDIHYRSAPAKMMGLLRTLSERKVYLLDEKDLATIEGRLSAEAISAQIAKDRRTLLDPSSPFTKEQIQRDPLGFDEIALARLQKLSREGSSAKIVDGRIWSADQRHVFLTASTAFRATDTGKGAALAAMLQKAREESLALAPAGTVRIACIGGHLSALENAATIKKDVARTMLANVIGIALLGVLAHRRKMFIAIVFLPAMFGMACAMLAFAFADPFISAITIGCGTVLVAVTVDYDFQILYRIDNTDPQALAPQATVRSMLLQIAAAAGTTVAAFLCLTLSALPGHRQLGWFAAVGVIASALFSLAGLVYLIPRVQKLRWAWVLPLKDSCAAFLRWRQRHATLTVAVGFALLVAGIAGLPRLRFAGDLNKLNYASPARQEEEQRFLSVWGGFPSASAVVSGKTQEEALRANDRLAATLQQLAAEGRIRHFTSISALLPSQRTQEENARRWRAFWSDERRGALKARMAAAMTAAHFTPTAFQPFYNSLDAKGAPLTVEDFDGTGLDALIRTHLKMKDAEHSALSAFSPAEGVPFPEVAARIKNAVPGATVMDSKYFVEHAAALTKQGLKTLALLAAVATALMLYIFVRRIELVIAVFVPVWLSILFTLGVLGWTGQPINLVSSLFIVFIFGIGIHYSIALMTNAVALYNGHGVGDSVAHGGVLLCALISVLSFGSLLFAQHPALFSVGLAGLLGIVSSFCAAVLVVPWIMRQLLPHEGRYGTPSLKTYAGMAWAMAYLGGCGLVYTLALRWIVRLRHPNDCEARMRFARRYFHRVAVGLLDYFPYRDSQRLYMDAGPDAFKPAGVIVANHLSAFDAMVIVALPAETVMIVKDWVWRIPIWAPLIRDTGSILAREDATEELFRKAAEWMDKGVCVMFFPEGSRSPDGRMRRFHKGAFELSLRTGRDIIPVVLSDTQSCIPRHAKWGGEHRCVIRVLPRVRPHNSDDAQDARALADRVKGLMLEHVSPDWRIAQNGEAFWHNIRTLYNYRGAYVESYVRWKLRLDPIYREIDSVVPVRGSVLDLGCGYGVMSHILARKSLERRVIGVDFDERKIGIARQTALATPNLSIEMQDILEWEYPPADAALLIDVLHYWPKEKQLRILEKAAACLREGGVLIVRSAVASSGWAHRATAWAEIFARVTRRNRRSDGLFFLERDFYLEAFRRTELVLQATTTESSRGSNELFILRKGPS